MKKSTGLKMIAAPRGGLPAIFVHGGAWAIPDDLKGPHVEGCRRAADTGFLELHRGGSALDAVVAAVQVMEEDPVFDAGVGSFLNREGRVEMDAAVMRGEDLAFGAVAVVTKVRSAVGLARRVLERGKEALIVGESADGLAEELGEECIDPEALILERERDRFRRWRAGELESSSRETFGDTVGAVAVDAGGRVAAAGSTGGVPFKRPGRVGDTPLPGSGLLADDTLGAVSVTGNGELILRATLSGEVLSRLAGTSPEEPDTAVASTLKKFTRRLDGRGGVILVTPRGRLAAGYTTPAMAYAYRTGEMASAGGGV